MNEDYQPKGCEFFDQASNRQMMLVYEGVWKDWILYKHLDGAWVSLRKATEQDKASLANALSKAHHEK